MGARHLHVNLHERMWLSAGTRGLVPGQQSRNTCLVFMQVRWCTWVEKLAFSLYIPIKEDREKQTNWLLFQGPDYFIQFVADHPRTVRGHMIVKEMFLSTLTRCEGVHPWSSPSPFQSKRIPVQAVKEPFRRHILHAQGLHLWLIIWL